MRVHSHLPVEAVDADMVGQMSHIQYHQTEWGPVQMSQVGTLAVQDMHRDGFIWALAEDIDGLLEQSRMAAIESYKAQVWED